MKTILAVAALSLVFASVTFAADDNASTGRSDSASTGRNDSASTGIKTGSGNRAA